MIESFIATATEREMEGKEIQRIRESCACVKETQFIARMSGTDPELRRSVGSLFKLHSRGEKKSVPLYSVSPGLQCLSLLLIII